MTTDPYGDAGSSTFGPGGSDPVAPGYGISDPFPTTYTDTPTGASAAGSSRSSSSSSSFGGSTGNPTADKAKAEAGQVKDTAADAAKNVAGTAKEEAGNVVGEAKAQASNLLDQVKGEAGSQVTTQQQRLAGIANSYAKELGSMASSSEESGPLTDLVHQASQRAGAAGHWLENHEPAELLDEVRRFARRRPGAFLLSALAAGVVVGRLTRGAVDEARSDSTTGSTPQRAVGSTYSTSYSTPTEQTYSREAVGYDQSVTGYPGEARVEGSGYGQSFDQPVSGYGTASGDVVR